MRGGRDIKNEGKNDLRQKGIADLEN